MLITTAFTGAQKAGGIGNSTFTIKRTSSTVRIPFVPCDAYVKHIIGDGMDIEHLKSEISNLKDTSRFIIKMNLASMAALIAFVGFLTKEPAEAFEIAIRIKFLFGILLFMFALGLYCEYTLSLKGSFKNYNYIETLNNRVGNAIWLIRLYIWAWIIPILILATFLVNGIFIVTNDVRI